MESTKCAPPLVTPPQALVVLRTFYYKNKPTDAVDKPRRSAQGARHLGRLRPCFQLAVNGLKASCSGVADIGSAVNHASDELITRMQGKRRAQQKASASRQTRCGQGKRRVDERDRDRDTVTIHRDVQVCDRIAGSNWRIHRDRARIEQPNLVGWHCAHDLLLCSWRNVGNQIVDALLVPSVIERKHIEYGTDHAIDVHQALGWW